jgi:hypothetical protein
LQEEWRIHHDRGAFVTGCAGRHDMGAYQRQTGVPVDPANRTRIRQNRLDKAASTDLASGGNVDWSDARPLLNVKKDEIRQALSGSNS